MHIATIRQQGTEEIVVWGDVSPAECRDLDDCAGEALAGDAKTIILDLRSANFISSEFVGTVAKFAMDARALAKSVTIRACDHAADWLAWSGLHRIARLDVYAGPKELAGHACLDCEGDDLP